MKKHGFLLSLLLVFALVLGACADAGEVEDPGVEGVEPGVEEPLGDEDLTDDETGLTEETPLAEDDTLVEETPLDEGLTEETPLATDEALTEETPLATDEALTEETPLATDEAQAEGDILPATGFDAPLALDRMMELELWNYDDEELGEVEDLIIDQQNSQIRWVVVEVGGFLGIGEKNVPLPYNALGIDTAEDAGVSDDPAFLVNVTEEQLDAAPSIDLGAFETDGFDTATDQEFETFWSDQGFDTGIADDDDALGDDDDALGDDDVVATDEPLATEDPLATPDPLATEEPLTEDEGLAEGDTAVQTGTAGWILASRFLDSQQLVDEVGTTLGEVENAYVDPLSGRIMFVLLNLDDEAFGFGEDEFVAVPFQALTFDTVTGAWMLGVESDVLQGAPTVTEQDLADGIDAGFEDQFVPYWENEGFSDLRSGEEDLNQ